MSDKIELIKADFGPYASRLYKWDLFHDEEYRLDTSKGLKFLHFNSKLNLKSLSKSAFKKHQSRTVAVLALSPQGVKKVAADYLAALAADSTLFIPMTVGVAMVSIDDNYSKSEGRDESVKKMADIDMEVVGLTVNATYIYVQLSSVRGVSLSLRLNKKSGFSTVTGNLVNRKEDRKKT